MGHATPVFATGRRYLAVARCAGVRTHRGPAAHPVWLQIFRSPSTGENAHDPAQALFRDCRRCPAAVDARLRLHGHQESTGEYVDDTAITTKVKSAIFNEPSLKVFQIKVETYKSVVQLSGFVDSSATMDKASDLARAIPGVRSVKNDMRVK